MASLTRIQEFRSRKIFFSWTGALLLTGIILLVNFLVSFVPLRLDTSQGQVYSLSKGTKMLLKLIDDPMIIRMYFSSDIPPKLRLNERYVRDLLSVYRRSSHGKIKVEYVDPGQSQKSKQEALQAGVYPVQLNVIERDKQEIKESFMGLSLLYGDKKESISFIQDTQGLEYEITQRIKKLVKPSDIKIGFITNGKALTLTSEPLKPLMEPLNQLYQTLDVDLTKDIPSDVKALWLIGPTVPFASTETARLRDWVRAGGVLGLMIDRYQIDIQSFRPTPVEIGLDELLKEWGIDFKRALIVDPRCDRILLRMNQGMMMMTAPVDYPYFPLITDFDRMHPATKNLDAVSMPFVSPLIIENPVKGLVYTSIAKTSPKSWLDTSARYASPLEEHVRPKDATNGPFNTTLIIEGKFAGIDPGAKTGRVILFGCSRLIRTDYPPKQTNYNFFFNLLDWSGQDEFLLSIRSRGANQKLLREFSDSLRIPLKYSLALFLPVATLVAGFVILSLSKKRRSRLPLIYKEG